MVDRLLEDAQHTIRCGADGRTHPHALVVVHGEGRRHRLAGGELGLQQHERGVRVAGGCGRGDEIIPHAPARRRLVVAGSERAAGDDGC